MYLALVNFTVFNFGFHTHEKAVMMVTVPLSLLMGRSDTLDHHIHTLRILGCSCLLLLLHESSEFFIKSLLLIAEIIICSKVLKGNSWLITLSRMHALFTLIGCYIFEILLFGSVRIRLLRHFVPGIASFIIQIIYA